MFRQRYQEVNEAPELIGGAIDFAETSIDNTSFADFTLLKGMAVGFALNDAEKIVKAFTQIQGFAVELTAHPVIHSR